MTKDGQARYEAAKTITRAATKLGFVALVFYNRQKAGRSIKVVAWWRGHEKATQSTMRKLTALADRVNTNSTHGPTFYFV